MYLVTHSLLSSWLYAMRSNPYEDITTERDPEEEFLRVLRREPTETTEAMRNGIEFEDLVTNIAAGQEEDVGHKWYDAAARCAQKVEGGVTQYKAKKQIEVSGLRVLLYGRIDFLKAGVVIDTKFSKSYERGKYIDSTQHPVYLSLIPEAHSFMYLVSNGSEVWTETYRRDETPPIEPTIAEFFQWLEDNSLMEIYKEHWEAK
jgi:hypothetical protein